jgi:hypothetical protein
MIYKLSFVQYPFVTEKYKETAQSSREVVRFFLLLKTGLPVRYDLRISRTY